MHEEGSTLGAEWYGCIWPLKCMYRGQKGKIPLFTRFHAGVYTLTILGHPGERLGHAYESFQLLLVEIK